MRTQDQSSQASLTPEGALDILREGNRRFVESRMAERDLLEQVRATSKGQYPFAVVLSCIDSRVSAELVFDQGVGDIFSVRIAGNVLNEDILGSMEFACHLAGSKLVVILGHSACGAVKGACAGAELGHLTGLLEKIQPVIAAVGRADDASDPAYVQKVVEANVEHVLRELPARSEVLRSRIESGDLGLVGGIYSVATGEVEFGALYCGELPK